MLTFKSKKITNNPAICSLSSEGFTLLEVITITIILGILAAVAVPSWLGLIQVQRLNTAKSELFQEMRIAQQKAKAERNRWQVTFREENNILQWRTDASPSNNICEQTTGWKSLDSRVTLDEDNMTFRSLDDCWRVQFDDRGRAIGADGFYTGRITLEAQNINEKRCIYISTFLGAMREDKNQECE